MSTYISSNANRLYVAKETAYGNAASIATTNRFPAVRLNAHQSVQPVQRADKTGTRTFLGIPDGARRNTTFEARTYLASMGGSTQTGYGPFFEAALGAAAQLSSNVGIAGVQNGTTLQTTSAHGFAIGTGVSCGNEIRFVTSVVDSLHCVINAPFTVSPQAGSMLNPTLTYRLADLLPSVTIYDYWDPASAVSRMILGAAVDTLEIAVNGDFHEFSFAGVAADLVDNASFAAGQGGLMTFPSEPATSAFNYSLVPGHLGEVWIGQNANQFFTLSEANIGIKNNLQLRDREFGSLVPRSVVPGKREVVSKFSLYVQNDAQTTALYAAAKLRQRIPMMLQLGQQPGQLMGIMIPQVVPEIPGLNDSETRLQWEFRNNLATGSENDEIYIAFA